MRRQTRQTPFFIRRPPRALDIWRFQTVVSQRLLWWAVLNMVGGLWMQQQRNKFWRGIAMQSISWGAINAGIALIGSFFSRRRYNNHDNPYKSDITAGEERNLRRALWVNAGLDVFYVLGGLLLAWTRGRRDRLMRGNGWGVVIQGGFLMLFDVVHALIMSADDHEDNQNR